jgi:dTDP-glucose 4,6-dehydratase
MRLPADDLAEAGERLRTIAGSDFAGSVAVVTGGSGFVGRWLVETFAASGCGRVFLLTRNAAATRERAPHLETAAGVSVVEPYELPERCDFVIHAATDSAENLASNPRRFVEAIDLTSAALEFASRAEARRFLYISSGAVYGKQPPDMMFLNETFAGAPDLTDFRSAYGESKRAGELLCASYRNSGLHVTIARLFSVIGPLIPLGPKFAAGQFLEDVLHGRPVEVRGDGTPLRTYLYIADAAVWLWTMLLRGQNGRAYNAGSESPVSILDLARQAASLVSPALPVVVRGTPDADRPADRYVPSTQRAQRELDVAETIGWCAALRKTFEWYRSMDDPRF